MGLTKTHLLDKLTTKSGNSLLRHLGVFGTDQEIDKAVSHYKGHSLSLVLLGKLIKNDYNGDILKASRINLLDIDDDETNITEINLIADMYKKDLFCEVTDENIIKAFDL